MCQYCLCYFVKKDRYDLHLKLCTKAGHQYSIPEKDCAFLKFSNYKNIIPAHFVMYCDLETMITSQIVINRGKTKSKWIHRPILFGAITVCKPRPDLGSPPVIYNGIDCIDKLFTFIENWVCYTKRIFSDIYAPCIMSKEDKRHHKHTTKCFMCGRNFVGNSHLDKVRDHCHLSGKFHFTLCSNCNLTHTK